MYVKDDVRQSLSTVGECCCCRGPSSSVCRHSPKEYFKASQRTCPGSIVVIQPKPADKVVYRFVDAALSSVPGSEAARACKVVIRRSRPLPALVEGDASMFYHFAMEALPLVLRDAAKHGGLRDLRNHVVSQGMVQCRLCFTTPDTHWSLLLGCPPLYCLRLHLPHQAHHWGDGTHTSTCSRTTVRWMPTRYPQACAGTPAVRWTRKSPLYVSMPLIGLL